MLKGFHGYPKTFHLCGDIHDQACKRAKDNVAGTNGVGVTESVPRGSRVDVVQWDVTNLPLRTASVDLIVTDMVRKISACTVYQISYKVVYHVFFFLLLAIW